NISNIFALQKAKEHLQKEDSLFSDPSVSDSDISDIAAKKANELNEQHQYWKLTETYNSQSADTEIARSG
ncbi:hypothetical protein QCD73_19205, partial [Bacillus sp. PsM16]|uniref:hypothetical protein n=1 Tax=Bacillus sp. PsM16 TaxID=3031172 RepID=UPI00263B97D7